MKNILSTVSFFTWSLYLTYIFCVAPILFFVDGAQTTIALSIIGLPFFIIALIYGSEEEPKHRGYGGWIYISPAQYGEENELVFYFNLYCHRFTQLQKAPHQRTLPLTRSLVAPYQSAEEGTWDHYADLVVACKKGTNQHEPTHL